MTTGTQIRRKGIPTQEFLAVLKKARVESPGQYTGLILPVIHGHEQVSELTKGVPGKIAEQIRKKAGLGEKVFSSIIGYSRVHYSRLINAENRHLREAASNRLYRFAQILEHAIELYNGDEETALRWLKTPNAAFGNSQPLEMLSSEVGAGVVDHLITQLELGILPA